MRPYIELEILKYFLENYFNPGMDYADLEYLMVLFKSGESEETIDHMVRDIKLLSDKPLSFLCELVVEYSHRRMKDDRAKIMLELFRKHFLYLGFDVLQYFMNSYFHTGMKMYDTEEIISLFIAAESGDLAERMKQDVLLFSEMPPQYIKQYIEHHAHRQLTAEQATELFEQLQRYFCNPPMQEENHANPGN